MCKSLVKITSGNSEDSVKITCEKSSVKITSEDSLKITHEKSSVKVTSENREDSVKITRENKCRTNRMRKISHLNRVKITCKNMVIESCVKAYIRKYVKIT